VLGYHHSRSARDGGHSPEQSEKTGAVDVSQKRENQIFDKQT
jgi:hypothetical protein